MKTLSQNNSVSRQTDRQTDIEERETARYRKRETEGHTNRKTNLQKV
jgi:hypothetical protein